MSKRYINASRYTCDWTGEVRSWFKRELGSFLEYNIDHIVYRNNQGRGLSIIKEGNYWNVAVLSFHGPYADQYNVDFGTPLTDCVMHMSDKDEIVGLLQILQDLDKGDVSLMSDIVKLLKKNPKEGKEKDIEEEFYRGY